MNVINKFLIPALALGMFAACSDDNKFEGPETPDNVDGLYMSLTVSPASMSRTASPSNLTEAGQTGENNVNNLLLILVDKNSTVVDYARVSGGDNLKKSETDGSYTATGQFNRNNMISYLQTTPGNNDTKFYVVCNPTDAQEFTVGQNINDFICNKTPETYWTSSKFVMSNSKPSTVTLPTLADVQAGMYSTAATAFKIADTEVERVVARFDYAEKVTDSQVKGSEGNYYYELTKARTDKAEGVLHVSIKQLNLVNMGKAFYLFKRVNSNGLKSTAATMFGAETKDNYVVGPWGAEKAALNASTDDFDEYFYYSVLDNKKWGAFTNVSDIVKTDNKRGDATGNVEATEGNYYFWRYCLTNNLPHDPKVTQKNGNTTGIIFRAEITTPDTEGNLKTAMAAGDPLYAYAGQIIGNYTALKELIVKDPAHAISVAYNNSGLTNEQKGATTATDDINTALVANKFTIYKATNGHYYCDYYYWNRHNDNGKENEMGPMEFAVVRNNIYKLAVTEIAKLGHPTIKSDDPDPIKPDTPDETSDFYMKVKVSIKKWGVRVNNISFK